MNLELIEFVYLCMIEYLYLCMFDCVHCMCMYILCKVHFVCISCMFSFWFCIVPLRGKECGIWYFNVLRRLMSSLNSLPVLYYKSVRV